MAAGRDVQSAETVNVRQPSLPAPDSPSRSSTRFSSAGSIVRQFRNPAAGRPGTLKAQAQDPVGLKVVYRPQQEREVDIIFVHGLGGSSRATWSWNRDLNYFWPLEFLPLEPFIKDAARVLTFGYNANFRPGSGRNTMAILDFAKDLLFDLKYAQHEVPERQDLGMGEAWDPCSFLFVLMC